MLFADAVVQPLDNPTDANAMPVSLQKKLQPQIDELSKLNEQIDKDKREMKLKVLSRKEEKNGLAVEKKLGFKEGKIRLYIESSSWKDALQSQDYIYDETGRLRVVRAFGAVSRKYQGQTIYLDKKGNVLEVVCGDRLWDGFFDKAKKKILRKPLPLLDGSDVAYVWKPLEALEKDSLAEMSSKPGVKSQFPFLGAVAGLPGYVDAVAGYDWDNIGLKAEGVYWNPNSYNAQTDITINISDSNKKDPSDLFMLFQNGAHSRTDLVYVFGFRSDSYNPTPAKFYSGFGISLCHEGFEIEVDLVSDGFWNFQNTWTGFARVGFLHFFD